MNANATSGKESTDTLDQRDVRALTEYMSVLGCIGLTKDVGGLDIVVSQSGKEQPNDCDCSEHFDSDDLGCWPCYRDGFGDSTPKPDQRIEGAQQELLEHLLMIDLTPKN